MYRAEYDSLTPMERNCLRLAHHDRKTEQIAHELGIAASTVNTHVFAARRKLGGLPRLVAADRLRAFEATFASRSTDDIAHPAPDEPSVSSYLEDASPPLPLSSPAIPIAGAARGSAFRSALTDVREERATFVFDEHVSSPGEQDRRTDALHRAVLVLAIAVLTALVLISAPAIYDSAAQRIANSLERPHND